MIPGAAAAPIVAACRVEHSDLPALVAAGALTMPLEPVAASQVREPVLRCSPEGYAASCHAVAQVDWLGKLHRVKCPTLVIAGALDVGAPAAISEAIA